MTRIEEPKKILKHHQTTSDRARGYLVWGCIFIVLLAILAYLPALRCGFIWDDDAYVTENPMLTDANGLREIWFSAHTQSQYFPLVYTTFRVERGLWGLNPFGFHLVNILLHGLNAVLAWLVLRRLRLPGAWLAAAIFALHPVQVETVAWVTELKNIESLLFYLLALLAWMKSIEWPGPRQWSYYGLALVAYLLALFAKTTACTLPAALVLILWLRGQRPSWLRAVQILPFLLIGLGMGLVTIWWEKHLGNYDESSGLSLTFPERLLIAGRALWFYAGKLAWPATLSFSYPRWEIDPANPLQYLPVAGCVAVAVLLWARREKIGRGVIAGIVFFVAALSPLVGFITDYTFRFSFVADHYQYGASLGLIAIFAGLVWRLLARSGFWWPFQAALLLALGALTWHQCGVYRNLETLWRDTLAKNPGSWMAHHNLGFDLYSQGHYEEAIAEYKAALQIKPDYAVTHNDLGLAFGKIGRTQAEMDEYEEALRIRPGYAVAHNNLGGVLARMGRLGEAIGHCEQALRINPDYAEAHSNLGGALREQGRVPEAIQHFQRAVQLKPDFVEAHYNLGFALVQAGRVQEAIEQYKQTLRIKPDLAEAHARLGDALQLMRKPQEAIDQYEQVLRLKPGSVEAQKNLAWPLATLTPAEGGDPLRAVDLAQRACELTGNRLPAYLDTLAAAYAAAGRFDDAIATAQKAVELARSAGRTSLVKEIEPRLSLYRGGHAYRPAVHPTNP